MRGCAPLPEHFCVLMSCFCSDHLQPRQARLLVPAASSPLAVPLCPLSSIDASLYIFRAIRIRVHRPFSPCLGKTLKVLYLQLVGRVATASSVG